MSSLREIAPMLVGFGYGRDMSAAPTDIWYVHPSGHHVRAVPMPESMEGFWWEYFPPELVGDRKRGHGIARLQTHLASIHAKADNYKPVWQESTIAEYSPESNRPIDTADRDYFIVQTLEAPIERYEVRESGSSYPRLVAHDPKTGEWRDYSADANQESGDQRYIEVVRRWIQLGKPAAKRGDGLPRERDSGRSPGDTYDGYERPGFHKSTVPYAAGMGTPVYSVTPGMRG